MTEEKKSQIRKIITGAELILAAILVIYLVYGIATKNTNTLIFNGLAIFVVVTYLVLNDLVEPYLTEVFKNMTDFAKDAYKKYMFWDVASMAGLLYFVLNFTEEGSAFIYLGLVVYFIGSKQKRVFRSAFTGDVTEADVEAAKAAASEESEESIEE